MQVAPGSYLAAKLGMEKRRTINDKELQKLIRARIENLKDEKEALKIQKFSELGLPEEAAGGHRDRKAVKLGFVEFLDVVLQEMDTGMLDNSDKATKKRERRDKVFAAESLFKFVPTMNIFRETYKLRDAEGIDALLKHSFMRTILPGVKNSSQTSLASIADFSHPQFWDSRTRAMKRVWHLHVGPTNSGKTYHALKRLEEVKNGIYAGPLRLLAHEIYEKFNGKGIPCNLITGEEQRLAHKHAQVSSCTVEMVPTSTPVEVCVIDEIQMIGDERRGGAWTAALMGVKAKEVHLCGEERATELIQKLAVLCGDEIKIHRYKRLGPLEVEESSLCGDVSLLQKGDAYIAFSRRNLYMAKAQIEKATGMKCAIIYGGLPPEVRSQQAALFNDPDSGYDILVASDAIGMGLNLSIKRVVISTMTKWNGEAHVPLPHPMVRQIAGRAGRYKVTQLRGMHKDGDQTSKGKLKEVVFNEKDEPEEVIEEEEPVIEPGKPLPQTPMPPAPSIGYVTTLLEEDLPLLQKAMSTEPEAMRTAGIQPTPQMIENYCYFYQPRAQEISAVLEDLRDRIRLDPLFHLCDFEEILENAKRLDPLTNLTYAERLMMAAAPVGHQDNKNLRYFFYKFCEQIEQNREFSLLDLSKLPIEMLDQKPDFTMNTMKELEDMHKVTLLWLWLSYRFPYNLRPKSSAMQIKRLVEERIDMGLEHLTTNTIKAIEMMKEQGKLDKSRMMVFGKNDTFEKQVRKARMGLEYGHKKNEQKEDVQKKNEQRTESRNERFAQGKRSKFSGQRSLNLGANEERKPMEWLRGQESRAEGL